jgi:hypothetical protein
MLTYEDIDVTNTKTIAHRERLIIINRKILDNRILNYYLAFHVEGSDE